MKEKLLERKCTEYENCTDKERCDGNGDITYGKYTQACSHYIIFKPREEVKE